MSEDATTDLIRAITESLPRAEEGWQALSLVLEIEGGRFNGTYGYTYRDASTPGAVSVRPRLIRDEVDAYLAGYFPSGSALPVKVLVQYDRASGKYEITFEDKDSSRWQVTPANVDVVREELRPNLACWPGKESEF